MICSVALTSTIYSTQTTNATDNESDKSRDLNMNKNVGRITAIILSLVSITTGCTVPNSVATNTVSATKSASVVYFNTVDSEKKIAKFIKFLAEVDHPKHFQLQLSKRLSTLGLLWGSCIPII